MPAPQEIHELVDRFRMHRAAYADPLYNETQVRREFIDPVFKALGWDVDNTKGYAAPWREVVHEDSIRVGGATKAPDYSFRLGGRRLFFLEAKKPSVNLKDDPLPAYQLRRYAWTAKLPVSILTDFEEFVVYDTRVKPAQTDKAAKARVLYLTFEEYIERWDEIAGIFSPEAIKQGALEKYVESATKKRGTGTVDEAFLAEIEEWRDVLARNVALRNTGLDQRALNFAVQATIDRIVFLRICEDRAIEDYGRLLALLNGDEVYTRLRGLFERADERYNSGLFHFHRESGREEEPDTLTPRLSIDDKVLKTIIRRLYYPDSPYEFSVFPAEILGQVYERFLGSVIRLTPGGQAKVEQKPEVRKAGGVYYTPSYIVDYIVEQTVGKLLEGQTPQQAGGMTAAWKPATSKRPIAVLDPACGSGSFLLGAYQFLLDWYLEQYQSDPEAHSKGKSPRIFADRRGAWRLTTVERKRILLDHIYGVDLDPQAVEVTKLSLLLKVLEGETDETLSAQLSLLHERALPDLAGNIKCGNSLIGPDYHNGKQLDAFDEEEVLRINAFDWNQEFAPIMQSGGFDAVIGNPPYVRIQTLKKSAPSAAEYLHKHYQAASSGNYDIYVVFIEKGLSLLDSQGRLGFICPHKFFHSKYGEALRTIIAEGQHLEHVMHFGDKQIFPQATTYTCLLFLRKTPSDAVDVIQPNETELASWRNGNGAPKTRTDAESPRLFPTPKPWVIANRATMDLAQRLGEEHASLGSIARLFVGLQTDADEVYILEELGRKRATVQCASGATGETHAFEHDHLKYILKGSVNIRRYALSNVTKRLIFPYTDMDGRLIPPDKYEASFPLTWAYLKQNERRLRKRGSGRLGREWYGYIYKKNHARLSLPKLVVPSIASAACFAADFEGHYYFTGSGGGGGGGYGIVAKSNSCPNLTYLLGVLNSRVSTFYIRTVSTPFRGGYFALNRQFIEGIPIPLLEEDSPAAPSDLVALVERMLTLQERRQAVRTNHERSVLERQIAAVDRQIDEAVYALYGLSGREIDLIEERSDS